MDSDSAVLRILYTMEVAKRCRLSWLINSALVYEPKRGRRGVAGSELMSSAVHMEPKLTINVPVVYMVRYKVVLRGDNARAI